MLYKDNKDIKYRLDVKQSGDTVTLSFSADCGKHGTWESLDEHEFSIRELLTLLQKNEISL